jgi:hypothetical protein
VSVGITDGERLGRSLGRILGKKLGASLGMALGIPDGSALGIRLGVKVGRLLVNDDGTTLGAGDGSALRVSLGDVVRTAVLVGTLVGEAVRSNVAGAGDIEGGATSAELCKAINSGRLPDFQKSTITTLTF